MKRCERCGYDRTGLPAGSRCPECALGASEAGWSREEQIGSSAVFAAIGAGVLMSLVVAIGAIVLLNIFS